MALENADFIAELEELNPPGTDGRNQGDDHLRTIKRAVKGSFPNFVGTQIAPSAVVLTEAQLSDAALKSAAQAIGGTWQHTGRGSYTNSWIVGDGSNPGGAPTQKGWRLWGTGTAMHFTGQSDPAAPGQFVINASTNLAADHTGGSPPVLKFQVLGVDVGEARERGPVGGLGVYDEGGTWKRVGIGNPTRVNVGAADLTLLTTHFMQTLDWSTGTVQQILDIGTQTPGFNCTVVNRRSATNGTLALTGNGVTLIWVGGDGAASSGADLLLAQTSICTLNFITANNCLVYGNGISVL